jgi:heme exporter protein D
MAYAFFFWSGVGVWGLVSFATVAIIGVLAKHTFIDCVRFALRVREAQREVGRSPSPVWRLVRTAFGGMDGLEVFGPKGQQPRRMRTVWWPGHEPAEETYPG